MTKVKSDKFMCAVCDKKRLRKRICYLPLSKDTVIAVCGACSCVVMTYKDLVKDHKKNGTILARPY